MLIEPASSYLDRLVFLIRQQTLTSYAEVQYLRYCGTGPFR